MLPSVEELKAGLDVLHKQVGYAENNQHEWNRRGHQHLEDSFIAGDCVLCARPGQGPRLRGKLIPRCKGPFRVVRRINEQAHIVHDPVEGKEFD